MKKYFSRINKKALHFLIFTSCFLNLPSFCAFLIKVSLFKPKFLKKKIKTKKTFLVLFREIGIRDIEIIYKSTNNDFEFIFLKRSIFKVILFYFSNKKKSFFDYFTYPTSDEDFFNQKNIERNKHEKFLSDVIFILKKYYKEKALNLITFNYTYAAEAALYFACKRNNLPVLLWHKEGVQSDVDSEYQLKTRGIKFRQVFKYFTNISVYNEFTKKNFKKIDKRISKKIVVNGCPRLEDYIVKKKYYKKPKTILFLYFDKRRGIPKYNKYKNLSWSNSYDKVIEILNELSINKSLNIIIKIKPTSQIRINEQINKRIKIFKSGSAERFINQSDIVIGHNSSSTLEAIANGKLVMVPFFENNLKLKKYLLKFDNDIIYTSKKIMKKTILNFVNKKLFFPQNSKKYNKTIKYYFSDINSNNIIKKYFNFLKN